MKPEFLNGNRPLKDITIKHSNDISAEMVQNLYMSVGWQHRDLQAIKTSLEKSVLVTSAWDKNVLAGIARATGDGVFNATIWDVAVRPNYQNNGIGKLILKSMLTKLDDCDIPLVTLYTSCTKKDFYSKLGFELNLNKVIAMYRRQEDN